MRKYVFLLGLVLLFSLFCGCKPVKYEFEQPLEQVKQVFIVLEDNGSERRIECKQEILTDIQSLSCQKYWNDPPHTIVAPYVLIEYNNGAIEEICAQSNYYELDGKFDFDWEYFDSDEFLKLLQKYQ